MIAIDDMKLKTIIHKHGSYAQISKAVEELIELSEVLIKDINKGICDKWELVEEMADVEVMLAQLKIIYNVKDENLQYDIDRKIERTLKEIEDVKVECDTCKHLGDYDWCRDCHGYGLYEEAKTKTDCAWR